MSLLSYLALIVLVVFLAVDFTTRLDFSGATNKAGNEEIEINVDDISLPTLSKQTKKQLLEVIASFEEKKPDAEKVQSNLQGLSNEEQIQQSGQLKKVYIGDNVYQLLAIILPKEGESTKPFDLLAAQNIKSHKKTVEKVETGQLLGDYSIEISGLKSVDFQHKNTNNIVNLIIYKISNT